MARLRVAVVFGGRSVEHEVSRLSARSVIAALDPEKYEIVPLAITREGAWLPPGASHLLLAAGGAAPEEAAQAPAALVRAGSSGAAPLSGIDVVFPLVHGTMGEDGTLQGFLELAGIPYVGAGVLGSAVGMDKAMMKRVFREAGLPVVPFLVTSRAAWGTDPEGVAREVAQALGYPCFVKPANGGSSVGITKVRDAAALPDAVELALRLDRKAVIERGVQARELECAVLGNDYPEASVVGEVRTAREFYDYEAKYFDDHTQLVVPADLPDGVAQQVRELAVRAFQAVDCAGMARVDFFWVEGGGLYVNEINTIPGFTSMSMYPRMWQASGLSYPALVDRLVQLALERHQERQRTQFDLQRIQPSAVQR